MVVAKIEWAAPTYASATIRMTLKPQATPARHIPSSMEDSSQLTYRLDATPTFTEKDKSLMMVFTIYRKSDYMGCRT